MNMHKSITAARVERAYKRSMSAECHNPGFCVSCGRKALDGVEPDARKYTCEACGEPAVFGAEELLMMLVA